MASGAPGRAGQRLRLNKVNRVRAGDSLRAFPEGDGPVVAKEGRAEAEDAARVEEEGEWDR